MKNRNDNKINNNCANHSGNESQRNKVEIIAPQKDVIPAEGFDPYNDIAKKKERGNGKSDFRYFYSGKKLL